MDRICELFRVLGNTLDLEETLSTLDGGLRRLVPYEAIAVYLVEDNRLLPAYAAGLEPEALASLECRLGEGLLGTVAEARHPVLTARQQTPGGMNSALVLPLEDTRSVSAVLALFRDRDRTFAAADLELVMAVAPKLAAAIGNARAYQHAAKLAGIDMDTGVLNARSMFQRIDAELARTRRLRQGLAVVHCAIEGLDPSVAELSRRVLRQVAEKLSGACREYDTVARTGDDFVLVLAGLGPKDLDEKRWQLQRIVGEMGFQAGLPLAVVTGAAFFPEDGADTEALLAAAGARLHAARRNGHGVYSK